MCVCVCVFVCVVRAAVGGPNEKVRFLTCNHFLSPAQGDLTTKSMVDAPPIFIVLNGVFLSAMLSGLRSFMAALLVTGSLGRGWSWRGRPQAPAEDNWLHAPPVNNVNKKPQPRVDGAVSALEGWLSGMDTRGPTQPWSPQHNMLSLSLSPPLSLSFPLSPALSTSIYLSHCLFRVPSPPPSVFCLPLCLSLFSYSLESPQLSHASPQPST